MSNTCDHVALLGICPCRNYTQVCSMCHKEDNKGMQNDFGDLEYVCDGCYKSETISIITKEIVNAII
jgi:hypothetical protein